MPPVAGPAVAASEARQVLLGTLAGHLFAAVQRRPPRTLRIGAVVPDPAHPETPLAADLVVAGGPALPGSSGIAEPLVIVEVLGPASEEAVRRRKLPAFHALAGCREILLVQEQRFYCEVHRRLSGGHWITDLLLDRDARLRLEVAGLELPLSVLYAQSGLPRD
ncbi:MAG: Uma2 family endonuclease [Rhodospirillaceae bacterium]